ncbi:uncharacterized protein DUF2384 [Marinobacter sp. 3-2]|jgi:uncharacterized protein (DUF2384 family)|uniref:antitoxin Xre/MbcA/ParS toxin-binding domain-containing protein n=1 Tax=Marinobacter sp. 3-2 TaxID=2485141 RepID=UPI000D36F35F|nr:antitoxin Xre/MbcA/ParS toxin-binding domain-containing protein [Marinobacter sp. 3-2]ROQ43405.1 uncharacterized protein DUF2384 [Marinobacter sp. 3-2]
MENQSETQLRTMAQTTVRDVIDVYEGDVESAILWLLAPLPALNGKRPVDCFSDPIKILELQALLRKVDQGDFS